MLEIKILKDVVNKLENAKIKYMLTGSLAMNFYSIPRMTRDIDIVIHLVAHDIQTIVFLFQDDYYISENAVKEAFKYHSAFNIIHNQEIVKIDFIIRKNQEYRREEFERRKVVSLKDFRLYIVSVEDLIISKLIWAHDSKSFLQKQDIENLLKTDCDFDYLRKWLTKLNLINFFKEFMDARYF